MDRESDESGSLGPGSGNDDPLDNGKTNGRGIPADGSPSRRAVFKRLIVACDGTWLNIDSGSLENHQIPPPSNVVRLTRAIRSRSEDGIAQIVYYQAGIGSMGTKGSQIIEGITGDGLAEHVKEAYSFLANNWEPGDEIFLIGFSRGAFTARAVGGLISGIGLLTRKGLESFIVVYKDFAHRYSRSYRSPDRNIPFPNKPPFRSPDYIAEMERRGLTTPNVQIKAIAVFDTVGKNIRAAPVIEHSDYANTSLARASFAGSLGIPRISWLGRISQDISNELSDWRFYDTQLDPCIEHAFQALALDERRAAFQPAVWEKPDDSRTKLVQCWFPGAHSNVGGGLDDQEIANISLGWMMSMLEPLLDLNLSYIITQDDANVEYYRSRGRKVRPWSFGYIPNSESWAYGYKLAGGITRTPGDYYRINPRTGETTNRPLRNTNEYMHASVRSRYVEQGPGIEDKGTYAARALRDWRVRYENIDGLPSPWYWELQTPEATILPEAPLREVEIMLLKLSPRIMDYVLNPPPKREPRRRSRH